MKILRRGISRGRLITLIGLPLLALALSGCEPYPLWPIKPASPTAARMDQVWEIVTYVALGIVVVVGGLMLAAILRFGRRGEIGDDEPAQIHGNSRLEIAWTFIPTVIVLVLLGVAVRVLQENQVPSALPANTLHLQIQGYQWGWSYKFPQLPSLTVGSNGVPGQTEPLHLPDLHLPTGRTIVVQVTARDVIHDWWVPALDGHLDAYPGTTVTSYYHVTKPGTFYEECSKFCGRLHWQMHNDVIFQQPADFARWAVTNGAKPAQVAALLGVSVRQLAAAAPVTSSHAHA